MSDSDSAPGSVRRGGEFHENGSALDDVRAGVATVASPVHVTETEEAQTKLDVLALLSRIATGDPPFQAVVHREEVKDLVDEQRELAPDS
jgi:hypothetical protein